MKRIILLITLVSCVLAGFSQSNAADMEQVRKLVMAHSAIANLYVDSVDEPKLVEASIKAMLKELDPHSTYLNAKEVEKMNEPLQGNFEGIGVQFNMNEDTLVVIQPVSGGPSEKAGILAGDMIVAVDDSVIAGIKISREEIMKRLRGPKGSKVELSVKRRGIEGLQKFTVIRDKIPVNCIDAAFMIDDSVGYIKLSKFTRTTIKEFDEASEKLLNQGMKRLIFDLRDNTGGYFDQALMLSNQFLHRGDMIVYMEGMNRRREDFDADGLFDRVQNPQFHNVYTAAEDALPLVFNPY